MANPGVAFRYGLERWDLRAALVVGLITVVGLGQAGGPRAVEQLAQLRKEAQDARKSGDMPARVRALVALEGLLNHSPEIVKAAAKAYASMGDSEHAFAALEEYAAMGQADEEMAKDDAFAKMREVPRFRAWLGRMAENEKPVQRAETVFTLNDKGVLAEDIDYDRASQSFLLTSVLEKKIFRVDAKGKSSEFAKSPSGWPMLAIKIDVEKKLVWATEVALDGVEFAPKADWGKSAVLCFELQTGRLVRRVEGPPHAQLGDMVLGPKGNPIVSDGDGGGVYELVDDKLVAIDTQDFISPQTPAMAPNGKQVFVSDYTRGIGLLDLASKLVTWLKGAGGHPYALSGVDGLYFDRGTLLATQNGTSPERVVRFTLGANNDVTSEEVVEGATKTLGDPTHGVVVGDWFYYIANSGWNYLDDHGVVKAGVIREAPRVMRFRVR